MSGPWNAKPWEIEFAPPRTPRAACRAPRRRTRGSRPRRRPQARVAWSDGRRALPRRRSAWASNAARRRSPVSTVVPWSTKVRIGSRSAGCAAPPWGRCGSGDDGVVRWAVTPASAVAAAIRSASRPSNRGQPVSTSTTRPTGHEERGLAPFDMDAVSAWDLDSRVQMAMGRPAPAPGFADVATRSGGEWRAGSWSSTAGPASRGRGTTRRGWSRSRSASTSRRSTRPGDGSRSSARSSGAACRCAHGGEGQGAPERLRAGCRTGTSRRRWRRWRSYVPPGHGSATSPSRPRTSSRATATAP